MKITSFQVWSEAGQEMRVKHSAEPLSKSLGQDDIKNALLDCWIVVKYLKMLQGKLQLVLCSMCNLFSSFNCYIFWPTNMISQLAFCIDAFT